MQLRGTIYLRMYKRDQIFVTNAKSNYEIWSLWYDTDKKERIYADTVLIYPLWYDFPNDFDAQSDFGKYFVTKKLVS